jgi:hypothetical protein
MAIKKKKSSTYVSINVGFVMFLEATPGFDVPPEI